MPARPQKSPKALRKKQLNTAARPQRGDPFLTELFRYPRAKADFERLHDAGVSTDQLLSWLKALVNVKLGRRLRPLPLQVGGRPIYAARRFARRICRWADEIEAFNRATQADHSTPDLERLIGTTFPLDPLQIRGELPERLRLFASYVQVLVKMHSVFSMEARRRLEEMQAGFVHFLRSATGRLHLEEATRLLNAAYLAVGRDVEIDGHALEMSYRRSRWSRDPEHAGLLPRFSHLTR